MPRLTSRNVQICSKLYKLSPYRRPHDGWSEANAMPRRKRPDQEPIPSTSAHSMGTIAVRAATNHPGHRPPQQTVDQYIWTPRSEYQDKFPSDYHLTMLCTTSKSGIRRFSPSKGGLDGSFLLDALQGGIAYLAQYWKTDMVDKRERLALINDYHFQRFVFQWSWNRKCQMEREVERIQDIRLHSKERPDVSTTSILPLCLARHSKATNSEQMHAEAVRTFLGEGLAEANRREKRIVPQAEFIRRRIIELARTDPMEVGRGLKGAEDRCLQMIQDSFFNDTEVRRGTQKKKGQEVRSLLWEAYKRNDHLDTAGFRKWFLEEGDDLVQSIVRSSRSPVSLRRPIVHREFSQMVWESIEATSFLVRTQMRGFLADLPEQLSQANLAAFNALYDQHWWSGGLIPLMFYAHFDLLWPLFQELFQVDCSDASRVAFANVVYLKTTMVKNRREADRVRKAIPTARRRIELQEIEGEVADNAQSITSGPEPDELDHRGNSYFQTIINDLGIDGAASRLRAELEGKSVTKRLNTLVEVRRRGTEDAVGVLMALAADGAATPSIRVSAIKELGYCHYTEQLVRQLEQTVLQTVLAPKERIAAIDALVALHKRHSQRRRITADILTRIETIGSQIETHPRVRRAIRAAAATVNANER
jgi:hypothetical protein